MISESCHPNCFPSSNNSLVFISYSYINISHAAIFSSEDSPPGLLGISGSTLRIVSFDRPISGKECRVLPPKLQPYLTINLPSTPRRLTILDNIIHPIMSIFPNPLAMVICSEPSNTNVVSTIATDTSNQWSSFVNLYDVVTGEEKFHLNLVPDEMALCGALISFHGHQSLYYVLGTGTNVSQMPLSYDSAWIHVYEWIIQDHGAISLNLLHKVSYEYFYSLDASGGITS